jgi:hypothetical protein
VHLDPHLRRLRESGRRAGRALGGRGWPGRLCDPRPRGGRPIGLERLRCGRCERRRARGPPCGRALCLTRRARPGRRDLRRLRESGRRAGRALGG